VSPETLAKIARWRQKGVDGTLTQEDMREAIIVLRADRVGAQIASTKSHAKKAPKAELNADDLLGELGDL
jgi:hypothetical protein